MTAQSNKKPRNRVDKAKALTDIVERKLTFSEAASNQGVTRQAIHSAIKDLIPPKDISTFKDRRADILAYSQYKDLATYLNLDKAERKSLIMKRGLVDMGISYDKERLERGGNTQAKPMITINIQAGPAPVSIQAIDISPNSVQGSTIDSSTDDDTA